MPGSGLILILLLVLFFILLFITFRPPVPKIQQLVAFVLLLGVTAALAYLFWIRVLHGNPNPGRLSLANWLTRNRLIDLTRIVPGVNDMGLIYRLDTDLEEEQVKEEWLVFYRYDVVGGGIAGPFGGAVYDVDRCRPPTIHAYELVPVSYDYLGEEGAAVEVANIIEYRDPLSTDQNGVELDRPEVIITGFARGVATDLNIFRKVGGEEECTPRRRVQITPVPGQMVTTPFGYQNIGSFRGSYAVRREGAKVIVLDRAGFERSQFVIRRVYTPRQGSYFRRDNPELLVQPDEVGLAFGPGRPDETRRVYYPEKTVLAFFLELGSDPAAALSYVCGGGKETADYHPEEFGLRLPLAELEKVVVCELRYDPDVVQEQNHESRTVWARVAEVKKGGRGDCEQARPVECTVTAAPRPGAQPYGCEWCLLECR